MLAAISAGICAASFADDGLAQARQRGKLLAGIHYVVPEYKGGMKFRTPEAIDTALMHDLSKRLQLPLDTIRSQPATHATLLSARKADVVLATVTDTDPLRQSFAVIPTGYTAAPMAIMRSDTDIKSWEQLKGRKVCVSEGGLYVGKLAAQYGAIEKIQKAPADSLLALRIGSCDAAVHDSALLEELLKLPEWKKFSARLPAGPRTALAFVVSTADKKTASLLKQVTSDWAANNVPQQLTQKAARHIAFEVYLDQDVPDCH